VEATPRRPTLPPLAEALPRWHGAGGGLERRDTPSSSADRPWRRSTDRLRITRSCAAPPVRGAGFGRAGLGQDETGQRLARQGRHSSGRSWSSSGGGRVRAAGVAGRWPDSQAGSSPSPARLAIALGNAPRGCGGRRAAGRRSTSSSAGRGPRRRGAAGASAEMRGLPARAADRRRSQLPRLRAIAAGAVLPARKPQRPGHRRRRDFRRELAAAVGAPTGVEAGCLVVQVGGGASSRRASPLRDAVLGRQGRGSTLPRIMRQRPPSPLSGL